ncbi:MAG: galactofuranose ABC transporter, permease protein YjfF [Succinivibrio sp.]|jgi:simple sugar transport system permease protein|uniref:galactofuranose ABC transporter, permease protein YjfF n=1 Tax=Succinivibrio sp. TaxID=2053619 RepID=UPI000D7A180D|nr:sugar ABC transporter permease YjfF [Succinatimonas sp.]MDD6378109.1 sugar ABC transporter permease YjfF [Succinatimonas sp.]MDY5064705.1 galactofuranose ABC transporter, permease protein YjfF [Succinivibrio sp.]MDY5995034.1 galactofuranose ABC transporter, permease protein YjfF [Succinivibrio sp.]PWM83685.1 MAG: sugar ABC transporter permease YjfF [Succinivibrio sp.]
MRRFISNLVASQNFPFYVTGALFIILFGIGSVAFEGFFSPQVFLNLFIDNAPLIIVTVGITFTIISGFGGIDLSVGAVVSLTCMSLAVMMRDTTLSPYLCMFLVLFIGIAVGLINGLLITYFRLQPFIVTLGTMFLCRGLTAILSRDSVPIDNQFYSDLAFFSVPIGDCFLSLGALIALVMVVIATIILRYTSFGRGVYAIGGNEQSARLMGLKVDSIRVRVYVISGFCAALGGITYSWIMLSGYTLHGLGMEMDAIASSVIGGTQLMGGVGFMPGTLLGVMIQGTILTLISFQGTLSAWWTKIVVGLLLCLFIIMQAVVNAHKSKLMNMNAEGSVPPKK